MRGFADPDALIGLVPAHLVTRLSAIHFGRGSEALDRARVLSVTASSAIEGVIVADADRAQQIINRQATTLRNRSEQELAGYRDAQDYLFREDWGPIWSWTARQTALPPCASSRCSPPARRSPLTT